MLAVKNGFTIDGETKAEFLVLAAVHGIAVAQKEPEAPSSYLYKAACENL